MGKKGTGHADLDDIFDTIARPRTADPPVSEQRRPSMHGGANGGARAAGTTAGCVASPARPHTASTGSTAAAAGGNAFQNAFQRRADEELGTTPAGPSAGASAKASAKRKRPSGPDERNDRPAEHEQTIAAPVRARGEIKRAERAVPTWPLEISDATLAKAADGALLKLARSVRPYAGGGAGGTPPTLGSSTALVLLGGWQLAPAGAARKLSLDALLLQLSPFAPFHAHALSFWTAATTVAGGGGGDDGGKAVDMLALELNASAASALLLAAAERLAGRQLGPLASSTQSGVQGGSGGLKLVEAARALLRTQPLLVIGDSCDGLCAQARIALAAAATEPRTAALARAILRGGAAGSSPALVRLAVSACSTAEARALLALAAETAATAKGADADAMGGQLERLCARHRQGKALACVGVAMAPVPSKGSVRAEPQNMISNICTPYPPLPLSADPTRSPAPRASSRIYIYILIMIMITIMIYARVRVCVWVYLMLHLNIVCVMVCISVKAFILLGAPPRLLSPSPTLHVYLLRLLRRLRLLSYQVLPPPPARSPLPTAILITIIIIIISIIIIITIVIIIITIIILIVIILIVIIIIIIGTRTIGAPCHLLARPHLRCPYTF
ncbi:hypothetical protein T492DRAFT_399226 [Pavlovales sp. CCMP2436]|nr:hypothetical protein T492DRAFT_399226 [Pavlovales sp. CCMP2436]